MARAARPSASVEPPSRKASTAAGQWNIALTLNFDGYGKSEIQALVPKIHTPAA